MVYSKSQYVISHLPETARSPAGMEFPGISPPGPDKDGRLPNIRRT